MVMVNNKLPGIASVFKPRLAGHLSLGILTGIKHPQCLYCEFTWPSLLEGVLDAAS